MKSATPKEPTAKAILTNSVVRITAVASVAVPVVALLGGGNGTNPAPSETNQLKENTMKSTLSHNIIRLVAIAALVAALLGNGQYH
jgi:hypothetical protein